MQAYLLNSLAQAQLAVSNMDTATGPYPIAGHNIGGGVHVPPSQSQTVTYGAILQNAAGTQWAYIADGNSTTLLPTKMPVPGVGTISTDVGGNWQGATQVWP